MSRPSLLVIIYVLMFSVGCNRGNDKDQFDTPQRGIINISVDESFKPVIEEQITMYEATYPGTDIIAEYKTEADCFRDLIRDSANRLVIITRGLSEKEEKFFKDSLDYTPSWNIVATDAIAIIVNANSNDTLFTIARLRDQLLGKIKRHQSIVFDGLNATSTVRFIKDSLLGGRQFDTSVVKAARSSAEVIEFVSTNENAIGLVGVSWIGNPEDTAHLNWQRKVKIAYMQCTICPDAGFIKPVQHTILTKEYPLVRGLYYVIKENYTGLGTGFVSFLKSERGQLIFNRAYLGPVMGFGIRNVKINEKIE